MTREEAKKMWPIVKAFSEGKEIEYRDNPTEKWGDVGDIDELSFDAAPECYRIKSEPKYRPFNSVEECWQEMQKHQPFGWLKTEENDKRAIICVDNEGIVATNNAFYSFNDTIKYFTFEDGTPFGVKEE